MKKIDIQGLAKKLNKSRHMRNVWYRLLSVLMCICVFITTYALILPAITMEEDEAVKCGMVSHTHSQDCYDENGSLICGLPEHEHDMNCLVNPLPDITYECGFDYEHTHDESCYSDGVLICTMEEHTHSVEGGCFDMTLEERSISAVAADDTVVTVTGPLPKSATASIVPVEITNDELYEQYGSDVAPTVGRNMLAYDISLFIGNFEYEPSDEVKVVVSSLSIDTNENEHLAAMHITENEDENVVEVLDSQIDESTVAFTTSSFSLFVFYTVDFTYENLTYSIPGGTDVKLSDVMSSMELYLPLGREIADVVSSDDSLISVEKIDGDYLLKSLSSFMNEQTLTLTLDDNSVIKIYVSYTAKVIGNGDYENPEVDKDSFADRELSCECDNGAVITVSGYLPDGLDIKAEPLDIDKDTLNGMCEEDIGFVTPGFTAYDISLEKDGIEYEPEYVVSVKIQTPMPEMIFSHNDTVEVLHIVENDAGNQHEIMNSENTDNEEVSFKTDSFSVYVFFKVNLNYDGHFYTFDGDEELVFNQAFFNSIGISESPSDIANVTTSTFELAVTHTSEEWKVEATNAFYTLEDIVITFADSHELTIKVNCQAKAEERPEYSPYVDVSEEITVVNQPVPSSYASTHEGTTTFNAYSDESTSQVEAEFYSTEGLGSEREFDGMTVTDKSVVYKKDDYSAFSSYDEDEFSVVLSALGQQYENTVTAAETVPVDVVFILDVSGSMANGSPKARYVQDVEALNNLMDGIMDMHDGNRVSVVTYGSSTSATTTQSSYGYINDVKVILPLDRYFIKRTGTDIPNYTQRTPGTTGYNDYFQYYTRNTTVGGTSHSNLPHIRTNENLRSYGYDTFNYYDSVADEYRDEWVTGATHGTAVSQKDVNILGGTFTQGGIQLGAQQLLNNSNVSWTSPHTGRTYSRTPVVILISDGAPTLLNEDYMDPMAGSNYHTTVVGQGYDSDGNAYLGAAGYYTILTANYYKRLIAQHYDMPAAFYTIGMGIYAEDSSTPYGNFGGSSLSGDNYKRTVLNPTAANVEDLLSTGARSGSKWQYYSGALNALLNGSTYVPGTSTNFSNESGGRMNVGGNRCTSGSGTQYASVRGIPTEWGGKYSYADASFSQDNWPNEGDGTLAHIITNLIASNIKTYDYTSSVKENTASSVQIVDTIGDGMEINTSAGLYLRFNGTNYQMTEVSPGHYRYTGEVIVKPNHFIKYGVPLKGNSSIGYIEAVISTDSSERQVITWDIPSAFMPEYTHAAVGAWYYEELPIRLLYKVGLADDSKAQIRNLEDSTLTFYTNVNNGNNALGTIQPNTLSAIQNPYYTNTGYTETIQEKRTTGHVTGTNNYSYTTERTVSGGNISVKTVMGNNGKLVYSHVTKELDTSSPKTRLTASKVWKDKDGNVLTTAPESSVTVSLKHANVVYDTQTLNASNSWTYTWENLPTKYDDGTAISWSVTEPAMAGYETTIEESPASDYYRQVTEFTAGKMYYFVNSSGQSFNTSAQQRSSTLDPNDFTTNDAFKWKALSSGTTSKLVSFSNQSNYLRMNSSHAFTVYTTDSYNNLTLIESGNKVKIRVNRDSNYYLVVNGTTGNVSATTDSNAATEFTMYEYCPVWERVTRFEEGQVYYFTNTSNPGYTFGSDLQRATGYINPSATTTISDANKWVATNVNASGSQAVLVPYTVYNSSSPNTNIRLNRTGGGGGSADYTFQLNGTTSNNVCTLVTNSDGSVKLQYRNNQDRQINFGSNGTISASNGGGTNTYVNKYNEPADLYTVTNKQLPKYSVTITKEIPGTSSSTTSFPFTASYVSNGVTVDLGTFNLRKGESKVFSDVPKDAVLTVTETSHEGYDVIYSVTDGVATITGNTTITVTNKPGVVLPATGGLITSEKLISFGAALCASVICAYAMYILSKKKRVS